MLCISGIRTNCLLRQTGFLLGIIVGLSAISSCRCLAVLSSTPSTVQTKQYVIPFEVGKKIEAPLSSGPHQWKIIMDLLKLLFRSYFTNEWTSEVARKRLDKLKLSLVKYYAKQNLLGALSSTDSTPRDNKGGIGFPSLEGALLSLAFLTFSVFLIDLIQTVLARLRTTTTTTAAPAAGRRSHLYSQLSGESQESWEDDDMLSTLSSRVLSSIEKPIF